LGELVGRISHLQFLFFLFFLSFHTRGIHAWEISGFDTLGP
jgi:hypothetical protein